LSKHGAILLGGAVLTSAGKLPFRAIIGAGSGGFNRQEAQQIMEDEFGKLDYAMDVTLVVYAGKKAAKA